MPISFLVEIINSNGGRMREGAAFDLGFTAADIQAARVAGKVGRIGSRMGATTVRYIFAK